MSDDWAYSKNEHKKLDCFKAASQTMVIQLDKLSIFDSLSIGSFPSLMSLANRKVI